MIGICKAAKFGYFFLKSQAGDVFVHASSIEPDEVGRRFLVVGEEVEFDLGQHQGRPVATNVRLLSPREALDRRTYFEEGEVQRVRNRGQYAFVLRPFGGVALLHWQNVLEGSRSENGHVLFRVGQRWRYRLEPPDGPRTDEAWRCVDAVEL